MHKLDILSQTRLWFVAILASVFVVACGDGDSSTTTTNAPASVLPGVAGTPGAAASNPTVGASSPTSGATNVATSINSNANVVTAKPLTATFSEAMLPASITTPGTFTLKNTTLAGIDVPGVVTINGANTVATFTPTAALAPATTYTATIGTAAQNAAGVPMPNPISWSFTTAGVATTAQAPVDLLTTANFAILAKTTITDVPASIIVGNIGLSPGPGSAVLVTCPEITGQIFTVDATYVGSGDVTCAAPGPGANKTTVDNAILDMGTAYADAAGRTLPDATELGAAGEIGGLVIDPGLYKWSTDVTISTDLTLHARGDQNAVWIFQIAGDLTMAPGGSVPAGIKVILAGGAKAANIFWQVGGLTGATLGTFATFNGNILSAKQAIANTGSVVNGRLLADTQVTLQQNPITRPAP